MTKSDDQKKRNRRLQREVRNPIHNKRRIFQNGKYMGMATCDVIKMPKAPPNPVTVTAMKTYTTRPGQARFRASLLDRDGGCVVTGTPVGSYIYSKGKRVSLLHAAHIKPLSMCKDGEYWDVNNGLTMRADIHQAFDAALFTIGDNGQIMPSRWIDPEFYPPFLTPFMILPPEMRMYLAAHRVWAFRNWNRWAF